MEPTTRIAHVTAFATLGLVETTHELARTVVQGMDGADPEQVAEETLCLVAVATARAAEVGLRDEPAVAAAVNPVLLNAPLAYRDYLVGGAMIVQDDPTIREASRSAYDHLRRTLDFYTVHLPPNQFPGERVLTDKMGLWMGRVSPPRLPESPMQRLERLDAVALLLTHLKLVLAFGRQPGVEQS